MENISKPSDFIHRIIEDDTRQGKYGGKVCTRFPPEPNGFLHIGHAKSICLNFGIAQKYHAICNLRFDDTNPQKENTKYVDAIMRDILWLGYQWDNLCYASDYFEQLYAYARELIKKNKAYVCELDATQIREYRGTLTEVGKNSPYQERSIEENLALFEGMRRGDYQEGQYTLRAKIDMSSANLNMRDPVIYRIMHVSHHRTADKWCIYPTYDFTHCLSDSIENVTHSLCTLEFEDHRPLYDWFLNQLEVHHPQQIEFARLQLKYTLTSKRKLKMLMDEKIVDDWDDPRLHTISGMRKRGIPAAAIRNFCNCIGLTKNDSWIEMEQLDTCIRDYLNEHAIRRMAVLNPLKITIENYPSHQIEEIDAPNHPQNIELGTRKLPFSKVLYIEREDFMEDPVKKFFRLSPGKEVKLRYAYCIRCIKIVKDESGNITELICEYDPSTGGGKNPEGRKVKGMIHWVSASHAKPAEIRLYERLFTVENPTMAEDIHTTINPHSLTILNNCLLEATLPDANIIEAYQFERMGYFYMDEDSIPEKMIFHQVISLRDSKI